MGAARSSPPATLNRMETPWFSDTRTQWWGDAAAWIARSAADVGFGSAVEVASFRVRPWSALLTVRTADRGMFFKAVEPARRYEVSITTTLCDRWPSLAPDVLAVDADRGWLLLGDHGTPIDTLTTARQVEVVAELMPAYAEMQAATTEVLGEWRSEGVPDRTPGHLPHLLERFVDRCDEADLRARCDAAMPAFVEACDALANTALPSCLDHADIHGMNVVFDGQEPRLIDWATAVSPTPSLRCSCRTTSSSRRSLDPSSRGHGSCFGTPTSNRGAGRPRPTSPPSAWPRGRRSSSACWPSPTKPTPTARSGSFSIRGRRRLGRNPSSRAAGPAGVPCPRRGLPWGPPAAVLWRGCVTDCERSDSEPEEEWHEAITWLRAREGLDVLRPGETQPHPISRLLSRSSTGNQH
jgi:Phosphotransferase enzyme family